MDINALPCKKFRCLEEGAVVLDGHHAPHAAQNNSVGRNSKFIPDPRPDFSLGRETRCVHPVVKNIYALRMKPSLPCVIVAELLGYGKYFVCHSVRQSAEQPLPQWQSTHVVDFISVLAVNYNWDACQASCRDSF